MHHHTPSAAAIKLPPADGERPDHIDLREPSGRTDSATARRFALRFGERVRWCEPWGKWIVWDGRRWAIDQERRVEAMAKQTADETWADIAGLLPDVAGNLAAELVRFGKATAAARGVQNTLAMARSEPGIAILPDALDSHPWLLNCRNGMVDLRTGKLAPHDPKKYLTKLCPVEYLPGNQAECPLWHGFLARIFADDLAMIRFVQRLFGSALVGEVIEHILPILWGGGANGKSVLLEAIMRVLGGDYAGKAAPDLLLAKQGESHPTERADLFGKRLVACVETDEGRRLAEGLVKELTGGDTIKARRMREDFWSFAPSHTAMLITNHKPTVKGTDNGIWRRLRLVPFTVTIPPEEQDKHLTQKLNSEAEGILRWLVDGCLAWQREGLAEPANVAEATEQFRSENDVLGDFIAEACLLGGVYRVKSSNLYKAYANWCEERGERAKGTRLFGEAITEKGFTRTKSNGVWYEGIGLRG